MREVRDPVPRPGEVLIRVLLSGICNTDLELQRGYHAFSGIPGHEFVGMVEGPEGSPWKGKRVVGEINLACGRCDWCRRDLGRHCPRRTVLGIRGHPGAHAELITLPGNNIYLLSGKDEEAVFPAWRPPARYWIRSRLPPERAGGVGTGQAGPSRRASAAVGRRERHPRR